MPIKLGTIDLKIPYSKAYLENQLVYQISADKIIEKEFTSNIFPTVWTEVTTGIEYTGTNNYGTWRISTTSYRSANYSLNKAFDGDTSTWWSTQVISSNSEFVECTIECPIGVEIQLSQMYLMYSNQGGLTYKSVFKGYNSSTGEWEDLYTLTRSSSEESETVDISSKNYYSKFKFVIYRYGSSTYQILYEVQAIKGIIRQTVSETQIVPGSTIALLHLDNNYINEINGTVASTSAGNYIEGKFGSGVGKANGSNSIIFNSSITDKLPTYKELSEGTKELTVECWFKANQQVSSSASSNIIFRIGSGARDSVRWYYDKFKFNGTEVAVEDSPYNTWVHIAYVIKAGIASLFINGRKVASAEFKTDTSALTVAFGSAYGGQFDEILIATEALYTDNFTPLDKPYVVE